MKSYVPMLVTRRCTTLGVFVLSIALVSMSGQNNPGTPKPTQASGQPKESDTNPKAEVHHDKSPTALREVAPRFVGKKGPKHVEAVRSLPIPSRNNNAPLKKPSLQTGSQFDLDVDLTTPYEGLGDERDIGGGAKYDDPVTPSDANAAVGTTQYVEWVNNAFGVFAKATGKLLLAAEGNTIWNKFGGRCETNNDGDPIVQFDKLAKRWVMSQFVEKGGAPFLQCIAVSQTDDAMGFYNRYAFQFTEFNDYGKLGVWPDAYYASFNMFQDETENAPPKGGKACAFEREKMLNGQTAQVKCFDLRSPIQMGLLPADLDGSVPPPNGTPNYFMNWGIDQLNVWAFHVDWNDTNKSTFKPLAPTKVDTFDPACGQSRTCIPQRNSPVLLQSLGDRMMYRLAYRNMGTREVLLVNHSVQGGDLSPSAIRWYVLQVANGTLAVSQQGTYAPDAAARWMGSIAMDQKGDILLAYTVSGLGTTQPLKYFPSTAITGRRPNDPPGLSNEKVILLGAGSQGSERWGDYSSVALDPADDCTFWVTSQYQTQNGIFVWRTSVSRVKFKACQ